MPYRLPALSAIDWSAVNRALSDGNAFALLTHVRADTDGIGSELALQRYLSGIGKEVRILNCEPLPERLAVLDPEGAVEVFREEAAAFLARATVVVVDVSERDRLGRLAPHVERHRGVSICLDHHVNEHRRFATVDVIEPAAPSTGALISELLHELGAKFDPFIAQAIYATIVADTGSFRFSNTSSHVMRLAADLIELGADPQTIHRAVLGSYTPAKVRLLAAMLGSSALECDGRLAWFAVSRALIEQERATETDAEGLVEYLRLIKTVRAAILLVEQPDERVKVSFRSEEGTDVNRLAGQWGGGGHRHAAGATLDGPLDEATKRVVEAARRQLFG